ncbi:MAG: hypothetical protein ACN6PV_28235, partial [Achromobacter sp.]|uniref:hypothetical protein n=1 Tax=Achromobacter sp. TaxID=134375 RepID=UPI003D04A704
DLLDALFDAFHADLQLGKIPRIIAKRRGKQRLAVTKITPRTCSVARWGHRNTSMRRFWLNCVPPGPVARQGATT